MRAAINVIGIFLIIMGIAVFAYQGISYTQKEKIAQIGSLQVTADTEKTVYFPPILGGISIVAGIALVFIGNRK